MGVVVPKDESVDWLLLKKVSRSFYLTLRLLPPSVRGSISLAYLLARLSDTEADGVQTEGEKELLARKEEILSWLTRSPDRSEIEAVWTIIREGQRYDGKRFVGGSGAPSDPLSGEELESYTYLVAGCVGEFWTRICLKRFRKFTRRPQGEMTMLGIHFGQGLQLVNILRDREEDAGFGRVYIAPGARDATIHWARACLDDAESYTRSVRPWRVRAACALPLLLARETLDLVVRHPEAARVKVSRGRVWVLLVRALFFQQHSH